MNLYKETIEEIKKSKHTVEDVVAIVDDQKQERAGIYKFLEQAKTVNYNDGFGGAEINQNLRVIFKDGSWLERREYDGSEWWEYIGVRNIDDYKRVNMVTI